MPGSKKLLRYGWKWKCVICFVFGKGPSNNKIPSTSPCLGSTQWPVAATSLTILPHHTNACKHMHTHDMHAHADHAAARDENQRLPEMLN
jgi:hypothetical protein